MAAGNRICIGLRGTHAQNMEVSFIQLVAGNVLRRLHIFVRFSGIFWLFYRGVEPSKLSTKLTIILGRFCKTFSIRVCSRDFAYNVWLVFKDKA